MLTIPNFDLNPAHGSIASAGQARHVEWTLLSAAFEVDFDFQSWLLILSEAGPAFLSDFAHEGTLTLSLRFLERQGGDFHSE
jgi:hypothetical protein